MHYAQKDHTHSENDKTNNQANFTALPAAHHGAINTLSRIPNSTGDDFSYDFTRIPIQVDKSGIDHREINIIPSRDKYEQEAEEITDNVLSESFSKKEHDLKNSYTREPQLKLRDNSQEKKSFDKQIYGNVKSGKHLPFSTRKFFEKHFDHNFSDVRIHTCEGAAESCHNVDAQAYTMGHNIVFGKNQYSPNTAAGTHLIAHELVHVVQQRGLGGTSIQCFPYVGVQSSTPIYSASEIGSSVRQVRSSRSMSGVDVALVYRPDINRFSVIFALVWAFPHSYGDTTRQTYVSNFEATVRRVWNDRYLLAETVSPHRTARVEITFDNVIIPQMDTAALELAELGNPAHRRRWTMDVRNPTVRDRVNRWTGTVHLGSRSTQQLRRTTESLRRAAGFQHSNTGGNREYAQAPAAHEFGHMIGLGDEYVSDVEGESVSPSARGYINDRIMNVGENVTPDAMLHLQNG